MKRWLADFQGGTPAKEVIQRRERLMVDLWSLFLAGLPARNFDWNTFSHRLQSRGRYPGYKLDHGDRISPLISLARLRNIKRIREEIFFPRKIIATKREFKILFLSNLVTLESLISWDQIIDEIRLKWIKILEQTKMCSESSISTDRKWRKRYSDVRSYSKI